ncbi:hypothetical protein [Metamycoplasma canadense]|uniref:hypothetical protein n=1 Tax=Metamycoplasma canadense TaxID=29554 RepID=UPI0005EFE1AD|nr:hypothetical protein [Metamycoplasma canadense]
MSTIKKYNYNEPIIENEVKNKDSQPLGDEPIIFDTKTLGSSILIMNLKKQLLENQPTVNTTKKILYNQSTVDSFINEAVKKLIN